MLSNDFVALRSDHRAERFGPAGSQHGASESPSEGGADDWYDMLRHRHRDETMDSDEEDNL